MTETIYNKKAMTDYKQRDFTEFGKAPLNSLAY